MKKQKNYVNGFPSPINGVSFKLFKELDRLSPIKFPSPISGVSFKLNFEITDDLTVYVEFPSPISGVSFKLSNIAAK